ncbi:hypothetical protein D6D13_08252 [Aureobasidium pullulans]|uniref:Uncharacterized protein n=1 Tax=Aureobasidium pullulans TaxID=5580 RepID=A0A4S9C7R3_AURPU|nr:hypothetical protein D6D13_08252 [Aureobasidium pullulans]
MSFQSGIHVLRIYTHILKIKSEEEWKIDRRWEEYEREAEEEEEADESEDERGDAIEPELRLEELLGERTPSPEERHRREEFRNNIQDEPSANSTTTTTAHKDRKPENTLTNQEVEEANVAAEALMTSYDKSKAMTTFSTLNAIQAFKNLKPANVQVSLGFYDDTPQVIGQNKVLWAPYRKPHGFDEVYDGRLNHHVESPMMPDLRRLMPDLVYCSILQATSLADYPIKALILDIVEGRSWPLTSQGGIQVPLRRWVFACETVNQGWQIGDPGVPPPLREGICWKVNSYLSDGFFTRFQIEGDLKSLTFHSTDLLAKEDTPIVKHRKEEFSSLGTDGICARLMGDNAFHEIDLISCYVGLDRLMNFLREMTQSLRVLCLSAVDMQFDGMFGTGTHSPLTFIKLVRNELELEHLMWNGLRSAENHARYVGRIDGEWETVEEIQDALQEDIDREESGHLFYDLDYESSQEDEEDEGDRFQFVEVNAFDEFGDDGDSSSGDEDKDYGDDINDEP